MITLILDIGVCVILTGSVLVLRRHWLLRDDHGCVLALHDFRTLTQGGPALARVWRGVHVQRGHDVHLIVLVRARLRIEVACVDT